MADNHPPELFDGAQDMHFSSGFLADAQNRSHFHKAFTFIEAEEDRLAIGLLKPPDPFIEVFGQIGPGVSFGILWFGIACGRPRFRGDGDGSRCVRLGTRRDSRL